MLAMKRKKSEAEELQEEEELVDGFGNDFCQLFQSEEVHSVDKAEVSLFTPLEKIEIPQYLHSLIDAYSIVLG